MEKIDDPADGSGEKDQVRLRGGSIIEGGLTSIDDATVDGKAGRGLTIPRRQAPKEARSAEGEGKRAANQATPDNADVPITTGEHHSSFSTPGAIRSS